MNYLHYYLLQAEDRLLKRIHCIWFYHSKYGIKNFGASRLVEARYLSNQNVVEISPQELYLGPDFLKDEYTLLDCPLKESPHFLLMEAIQSQKPLKETEYMKRFTRGCLDWRRGRPMPKDFEYWYKKNNLSCDGIINGNYQPVVVYSLGNRYYIFDGKHRAAMCALVGKSVRCYIEESGVANAGIWHYLFSIAGENKGYSKHMVFHNNYILSQING